jgi:hypothetical protein
MIKTHEEYTLKFEEDRFYIDNYSNPYPISVLNFDKSTEWFRKGVIWKIKVLNYDEQGNINARVVDYHAKSEENGQQLTLPLLAIERILIKDIDLDELGKSVVINDKIEKRSPIEYEIDDDDDDFPFVPDIPYKTPEQSWFFEKIIKIPFKKIMFGNGCVAIPYYLSALGKDISIEIANIDIRPEFEAIKDYFPKILKTKSVTVSIKVKHDKRNVLFIEASSDEVNAINAEIIDSVKFEFVHKDLFKFKGTTDKFLQTFDELKQDNKQVNTLLKDESDLLTEVLGMESAKHYLQVKYLAGKHEASVLKLRFILQPFSFIFLIAGENKYHLIWETLDSEEATYLWHTPKDRETLRTAIKEIEICLKEMKKTGRNTYVKKCS